MNAPLQSACERLGAVTRLRARFLGVSWNQSTVGLARQTAQVSAEAFPEGDEIEVAPVSASYP